MNESLSAAWSGLPGTNLNLIATLLRDSIIHLCKNSKIYDGWIEIDGIICISGKVEGQQLVVKVHENFRPQDVSKNSEGSETLGDNCGFGYQAERSHFRDENNIRFSNRERKRKRLDSGSEMARSSSAFRQYDHQQETANVSRSFDIDCKNGVKDLSMKKLSAPVDQNGCKDVVVASNNTSFRSNNGSSGVVFPFAVSSPTIAYQVDEMQVSYSDPYLGSPFFRPRPLGAKVERWNVGGRVLPECRVCASSFESSEALSDHNEAVHSLFTCLCCFKTFTSRSNLERHSRLHTGHKPYTCSICGKAFSRKDHLSNHATKHAFKCGTCSKRYADRCSLISHYHLDHCAALTNICAYCNKGFSSQEAFEDHVKIHPQFHLTASGEPDETVEEKHEVASQLSIRGYRHGKPKPNSLLAFYKHRSLLERANHALYMCLVCNRSFDHPWKYSSHLSTHPNELNVFKCCLCLQVCSTLAHLRQHEAAHFSELSNFLGTDRLRSVSGSSCDQTFESAHRFQTRLDEHQKMSQLHLGEFQRLCLKEQVEERQAPEHQSADLTCGLCDVRFVDQTSLLRHLEEHDRKHASDDTKVMKRGKRKQTQPKIAVTLERNIDEGSEEVEVVEPESPSSSKPTVLRRDRNTPEHVQTGQVTEDTRRNSESRGIKIRSDPIRTLMCSRTLTLGERDWDHENGNNGADMEISRLTEKPSLTSNERSEECLGREEVTTKDELRTSYLRNNSPYKFSYGSLASDVFQSSDDYRFFQRSQSSEGFPSVSTTPSDPGCLNNNNITSLRNENNTSIPSGPPYLCAFCDSKTETFAELDAHCQVEHSRSPCMFCAKTFAQKANRDRHHCLHTGDRPYGCPECDERFSRGDKLKMHRVRMHGVQYPAYSSRQKDAASSSRDYCASPSPPGSSYLYESFGQHPGAFIGHSQAEGSADLRETEEGDDRWVRGKGVSFQGDCGEEEPNGDSERRYSTMTHQTEINAPGDSARNGASSS